MAAVAPFSGPAANMAATRVRFAVHPTEAAPHCDVPASLAGDRPVTAERRAAYGLLGMLLGACGPFGLADLAKDAVGRPFVSAKPALGLSLAHTAGCVAAAVADGQRVGIDVERIAPYDPDTAALVLTPAQRALVGAASDPAREFMRLWVRKEAAGKALGAGIDTDVLAAPVERDIVLLRGVRILIRDVAAPDGVMAALALEEEVQR